MGNKIREIRESIGLSQEQLASETHISRVYLSKIETGKSKPSYLIAYRLSKRLGKPLEELFFNLDGNHGLQCVTETCY
ncbi:helix-turn-helix transcriptional regulator [Clostridium swellfunianum]|uniref:helix-turn-helix transcriptional regulator n=1 Tax=Clostridium swellfunianum TaxID=1367462 RepID=UPI00202DECE4|nr:helix-turn-helix transcriptional regulator [Clostridium swellfunianum]MCM0648683.1 helix-turn-helix transcriptional regulator [Clostridium swellfunianum]